MYSSRALYDFISLTIILLIERGYFVASCLTSNPAFPAPFVLAAQITTLTDTLRAAWLAYDANPGTTEKEALDLAHDALIAALISDAGYVTGKSGGDPNKIKSGGYTPSKEKSVAEKPPYNAEPGSKPGRAKLYYQKGDHDMAVVWLAYIGTETPGTMTNYVPCAGTTHDSFEVSGFTSGDWVNFVGAPIATNGDGTLHWTPPLLVLIP